MRWFHIDWYRYLLRPKDRHTSWPTAIICRMRGHPAGVAWYTHANATEPDMHCRNCNDDLG
jgi:hypothetical protein